MYFSFLNKDKFEDRYPIFTQSNNVGDTSYYRGQGSALPLQSAAFFFRYYVFFTWLCLTSHAATADFNLAFSVSLIPCGSKRSQ